ncbi:unnamed protein product [Gongylonema pulchrum]|uniref:G protein-coupled receptor n=1 Tax=Gongylonema pulchrum TaxID=637853 RepID=A0A183EKJ5_9BILA|nr:unnamed protein product [Gongylonema pulchrum]
MWVFAVISLVFIISTTISYSIIFITSHCILKTLRENATAARTKMLQRQLTIVMLFQAATPLICSTVPLIVFLSASYGGVVVDDYGSLAMMFINWQPCLNSIFSLYFVKPFRTGFFRLFRQSVVSISGAQPAMATKLKNVKRATLAVCTDVHRTMPQVN